jgi:ADP-heptose:LPS heptosyltransferase
LTGCRQRFGLVRPGRPRPLLSHAYAVPADFREAEHHQLELWERFLQHFGLTAAVDRSPLSTASAPRDAGIVLIPGSENTPEKRWPVAHWRALIDSLPQERFVVCGTPNDVAIADAVTAGYPPARVENLAGRTDLPAFADWLRRCRLLVSNDTGGMHLANALGTPLIALFGPTNPVRTGPVFQAPVVVLQPPGSAPRGGGDLARLSPNAVLAAVRDRLPNSPL